jgi:ATP synthase protein I
MAASRPHSGEMSQDSALDPVHPSNVTSRRSVAPAARTTKRAYDALSASSVGLELGISVIVGLLFGMWLDRQIGTSPWMMLLFLVFGLIAGFRGMFRAVRRAEKAGEENDRG